MLVSKAPEFYLISPIDWGCIEYSNFISADGYDPSTNECSGYDTKQSDGKALVLELW